MVLRDAAGAVRIFKAPSVPADPSEGVLGVLRLAAAQQLDLPLSALLRDCALFVHGSTVATNTILEKKGARVGMLTTEGFRDSLEIRRGMRENQWDHRAPFPEVLVPRHLRLPVRGRLGADGSELAPLVAEDVAVAAKLFAAEGVEISRPCACSTPSSTARTSVWRRRGAGQAPRRGPVGLAVERGHANHGRVRARLDLRRERLHRTRSRATWRRLRPPAAPARPAALAPAAAEQRRRGLSRYQAAARPGDASAEPALAAGVGALKGCAAPGEAANLISIEIGGTSCEER